MGERRQGGRRAPSLLPSSPSAPSRPVPPWGGGALCSPVSRCSPQEPQLGRRLHVSLHHLADPGQEEAPRGECLPGGPGSPQPQPRPRARPFPTLTPPLSALDHRETPPRSHQQQPVRAEEAGAQRLREAGSAR